MVTPTSNRTIGKAMTLVASFSLFSGLPAADAPEKKPQVFLEAALVQVESGSALDSWLELLAGKSGPSESRGLFAASLDLPKVDFKDHKGMSPAADEAFAESSEGFLALMSRSKLPALIRLFKTDRCSQVLATPFVLADDGAENTIDITETRYSATETTVPGYLPTATDRAEKAGIMLGVTPKISESGKSVFLDLDLEISEFNEPSSGDANASPRKNSTTLDCSATIPGEQVVVIGGLTRDVKQKSIHKVPVLGYIPLLGRLFRSEETVLVRNKLYVFIQANVFPEGLEEGIDLTPSAEKKMRRSNASTPPSEGSR